MTCRELIEFLADYLQHELAPGELAEFDRHLAGCRACANYLHTYRDAVALGRAVLRPDEDEIPPEVPAALVEAVLAARRQRPN